MPDYDVRTIDLAELLPLRAALLRRTDSGESSSGDEHPDAHHVAALAGATIVGVASIHPQGTPDGTAHRAWHLKGVAVEYGHRGNGLGTLLVHTCMQRAAETDPTLAWCLAPAGTFGFFERMRFRRHGDPLNDPTHGPRYLMFAQLLPVRRSWALQDA